ncbi:MAG: toxin HicA [Castellaniella sp.]|uniref:toxin HicA n=1 Tax=Castellaniella sp. TaxID=1955812 RepID=UPI003C72D559
MSSIEKIIQQMKAQPHAVPFKDVVKICRVRFGPPRRTRGNHVIFKTPWAGDPRFNLQNANGQAKAYQVRQVLQALDQLATYQEPLS